MIDVIDTALLAQNDAGGMAVFNELALAMAGGGEGALEHVENGIADAAAYIDGGKTMFIIEVTDCSGSGDGGGS